MPILQITAAGVLYRTEFAAAYDAISSIRADQILGVMKYTKVALQQLASEYVAYNDYPGHQNAFGLEFAYAIDKDGIVKLLGGDDDAAADAIKKLVRLMSETQEKVDAFNLPGAKNAPNSYIRDLFVGGIAKFGKNIDEISNDQILEIVANDKFMTAMVIAQDIGKTAGRAEAEMVEAIRRFRCISGPGECTMGGVAQGKDGMIEFFGFFEKLADAQAAGKISDQAWGSISKVITQMGVNAATDSTQAFNKSKGATQNLAEIALKLGDEGVELVAAEKKYDIIVDGVKVGGREYDNVFRINGLEVGREVKDWDPENIVDILWDHYFNGVGKTKKGDPTAAGQLYLDALELLNKGAHNDLTKVDKEWAFSKGDPSAIVDGLIEKIVSDKSKIEALIRASKDTELLELLSAGKEQQLEVFITGAFSNVLTKLVVNTKSI